MLKTTMRCQPFVSFRVSSVSFSAANANLLRPRVSVISIFFNAETFFVEAIESVIAQSFRDWELLLVDDGSTDTSTEIAKRYAKQYPGQIHYLEHPGHANRGMSATRNLGIAHARGEFVGFIDSDDVWNANKLADQVDILDREPDVGLVCGSTVYWRSWQSGTDVVKPSGHVQNVVVPHPEPMLHLYPLGDATPPCPSDILVRATAIKAAGGFEEHFSGPRQMYEDQAFLAKLYLRSSVYFSSSTWLKYRIHDQSCVSSVKRAGQYHLVRRYFLNWLKSYVQDISFRDDRIENAIDLALRDSKREMRLIPLRRARRVLLRLKDLVRVGESAA
jgi:glycosyltransferase involved in cell wall biosynthesis